jgi:hypothetical protein
MEYMGYFVLLPSFANIYLFRDRIKEIMGKQLHTNIGIASPLAKPFGITRLRGTSSDPVEPRKDAYLPNWQDNLPVQKLLDVVVGIMAEEYVRVARENEAIFKKELK